MSRLVMGFDFGMTKIGIAIGQSITGSATPIAIVPARDGKPDWRMLDNLVNEWQPQLLVVGLPLNMDGTMSEMGNAASKFSRRLDGRYHLTTAMMDERLSTFEAQQQSQSQSPAGAIDDIAARLILESWFRENPGR